MIEENIDLSISQMDWQPVLSLIPDQSDFEFDDQSAKVPTN